LGLRGRKKLGSGENCVTKRYMICSAHQTLVLGVSNEAVWVGQAGHVAGVGRK